MLLHNNYTTTVWQYNCGGVAILTCATSIRVRPQPTRLRNMLARSRDVSSTSDQIFCTLNLCWRHDRYIGRKRSTKCCCCNIAHGRVDVLNVRVFRCTDVQMYRYTERCAYRRKRKQMHWYIEAYACRCMLHACEHSQGFACYHFYKDSCNKKTNFYKQTRVLLQLILDRTVRIQFCTLIMCVYMTVAKRLCKNTKVPPPCCIIM